MTRITQIDFVEPFGVFADKLCFYLITNQYKIRLNPRHLRYPRSKK